MPSVAARTDGVHVVQVTKRYVFESATLDPAALRRLETSFREGNWFFDRWSRHAFRAAALAELERLGGLALVGPRLSFEPPEPFTEFFEPIELGVRDPQLKTLSGAQPTRSERHLRVLGYVLSLLGLGVGVGIVFAAFRLGPSRAAIAVALPITIFALTASLIFSLRRLSGKWFLLPGAVAIVPYWGKRREARLYTRLDTCAAVRLVHAGKTVVLMLELWRKNERLRRRPVTDREAVSFLAAWQSPLPPPTPETLRELEW